MVHQLHSTGPMTLPPTISQQPPLPPFVSPHHTLTFVHSSKKQPLRLRSFLKFSSFYIAGLCCVFFTMTTGLSFQHEMCPAASLLLLS